MAPIRSRSNIRAVREDIEPRRKKRGPPPGKWDFPTVFHVDGLAQGSAFKKYYRSNATEFLRLPHDAVTRPVERRPPFLSLEDLAGTKTLGEGAGGKVLLVRTLRSVHDLDQPGTLFAMKVAKKKEFRQGDMDEDLVTRKDAERGRLAEVPWNPFVNGIVQTFSDDRNIYLLLELGSSGNLRSVFTNGPLDVATAVFYYTNIVCALAFLEKYDIVHRDLKPDNILIGPDGYLRLVDFGSAALELEEKEWMLVGTPSYIPPECINPEGQTGSPGKAVDWWASGCILHEMVTGKMTFDGRTEETIYRKVQEANPRWPKKIRAGKNLKAFVKALLTVDAAKRLGSQNARQVMDHPLLRHVEWSKMLNRQYLAPYVPPLPDLTERWHRWPLPEQRKLPKLKVVSPPAYLAHDNRFPPRRQRV